MSRYLGAVTLEIVREYFKRKYSILATTYTSPVSRCFQMAAMELETVIRVERSNRYGNIISEQL